MITEDELCKMIDIANAIIEDPELGECNGMTYEEGVPVLANSMEKLNSETSYQIGNFRILLNQTTGNLTVQALDNDKCLDIRPKSDNSIIIKAQR